MPAKTEIYTWRLSRATKARLEDAARVRGRSVAQLLDELVASELDREGLDAAAERERPHNRARRFAGCLTGGPSRRSERVREVVRARLNKRRGHEC